MSTKSGDSRVLATIPTADVVVFPGMVVPLLIIDRRIYDGVKHFSMRTGSDEVFVVAAKGDSGLVEPIKSEMVAKVGTLCRIMRIIEDLDGGVKVLVQGILRGRVNKIFIDGGILKTDFTLIEPPKKEEQYDALTARIKEIALSLESYHGMELNLPPDFMSIVRQMPDPEKGVGFVISHLPVTFEDMLMIVEAMTTEDFVDRLQSYILREKVSAKVEEDIRNAARERISKTQREYYLREQLKAIKHELGEDDSSEIEQFRKRLEEITMPEEAREEATRQLRRLERTNPDSMEATVIRNHLEWLLSLPWDVETEDNTDITKAREILDSRHFGIQKAKERILDYLSVIAINRDYNPPILCFVGPPGVGKTSLGKSIAEGLGRQFARISLGGVHDESEIRGHRRTYVGALPGRFIQAIRRAGSKNPLIMIDEIDKIGQQGRGDPSAALLEVLDPEQNNNFYDNYLGVHFDLSKALFIATANDASTIPGPLRDRMEIVYLSGYTHAEKLEIAKRHLIPKAAKEAGLAELGFKIDDDVLMDLIRYWTRESGVRSLERQIKKLCAKFARHYLETKEPLTFTKESLRKFLGPRVNNSNVFVNGESKVGVTNGLAWTPYGGEILQVEAVLLPGSGRLILTGHLGEVMKESAQAAVSYAKANANKFGIPDEMFSNYDIHIHVPAGAIPKDGPSAGITLFSSVLSAFTQRPVDSSVAMTGELTLQGTLLPIGGVREKILAAKVNGIRAVVLPEGNREDVEDLREMLDGIELYLAKHVDEVLERVLMKKSE